MKENLQYIPIGIFMNLLLIFDMYVLIKDYPGINKFWPWLGVISITIWDILIIIKFYYGKK